MYRGGKEKEARDRKKETSAGEEEDLFIFNDTIEKRRRDKRQKERFRSRGGNDEGLGFKVWGLGKETEVDRGGRVGPQSETNLIVLGAKSGCTLI